MKKILLILLSAFLCSMSVFADDISDVKQIFNNYVTDANNYSRNIQNYYSNNAKIIRVVNKKQGGQQSVIIPFDRYLKELSAHSTIAKATKYRNTYINQKVVKVNNNYKLTATRIPRNDKVGLPCHFIFQKTNAGWKIIEESMTTNVQTFLSAK